MYDQSVWAAPEEIDEGVRWALTPLGAELLGGAVEASDEICDPDERNLGVGAAK